MTSAAHGSPQTKHTRPASDVRLAPEIRQTFCDALGAHKVLDDEQTLDAYAATTGLNATRARTVLRPDSTEDVRAIATIASQFEVPLYPISRGRNWGYGDSCPVTGGQVIVDLGAMNKIVEVNEDLAYAVIQPGVTQGQLSDYLRENHPSLWCDCTGAGPDVSIVGNILERGFGHTPYGNRFQTVCGMEAILADGRVLRTGMGHFANSKVAYTFPYGVGPYLDGLFTQGSFGIVTRLGLWLMPAPEKVTVFIASASRKEDLETVVDRLRPLRLDGTLRSVVHIGNDMRLISSAGTFPFTRLPDRSSLTPDVRDELRRRGRIGQWTIVGALYGDRAQVAAGTRRVRRALRRYKLTLLTERRLAAGKILARSLSRIGLGASLESQIDTADALYRLNRGVPSRRFLTGAYWRRRGGLPEHFPAESHPARDGCSFLWLSPTLPALGSSAMDLYDLVAPIFELHDFDVMITYSMINERSLGAVLTLAFDGDNEDERGRAARCYDTLFKATMERGYVPYRVGTQSMSALAQGSETFWDVVASIKNALDPNGLIAPGRYNPKDVSGPLS